MAVSGFSEEFFAERFRRPGNLDVLEQQLRDYDLHKMEQTFDKEFVLKNLYPTVLLSKLFVFVNPKLDDLFDGT